MNESLCMAFFRFCIKALDFQKKMCKCDLLDDFRGKVMKMKLVRQSLGWNSNRTRLTGKKKEKEKVIRYIFISVVILPNFISLSSISKLDSFAAISEHLRKALITWMLVSQETLIMQLFFYVCDTQQS